MEDDGGFFAYYNRYSESNFPQQEIQLDIDSLEHAIYKEVDGRKALSLRQGESAEFQTTVSETGVYEILVGYYCMKDALGDFVFGFSVDGELPYTEAGNFSLYWRKNG